MKQYYGIQALRCVCAMLVVAMHATEAIALRMPGSQLQTWHAGSAGVHIFFVISGFVMMLTTPEARPGVPGMALSLSFLKRRLIRIVPLYWIYTTLKVVLVLLVPTAALRSSIDWHHVAASYFFIPYTSPWGLIQPVLPVGWSLNFEMLFYVVFALSIFLGANRVFFVSTAFLIISFLGDYLPHISALGFYGQSIVFEFLLGLGIGVIARRNIKAPAGVSLSLIAAGVYLLFFYSPDREAGTLLLRGAPSALVVLGVVLLEASIKWNDFYGPKVAFLGDSSYSVYLSHSFVVPAIAFAAGRFGVQTESAVFLFILVASAIAGSASYKWIELPITRHLRDRFA